MEGNKTCKHFFWPLHFCAWKNRELSGLLVEAILWVGGIGFESMGIYGLETWPGPTPFLAPRCPMWTPKAACRCHFSTSTAEFESNKTCVIRDRLWCRKFKIYEKSFLLRLLLVGGFNPSEKYESLSMGIIWNNHHVIPSIWENKLCSNHQPATISLLLRRMDERCWATCTEKQKPEWQRSTHRLQRRNLFHCDDVPEMLSVLRRSLGMTE